MEEEEKNPCGMTLTIQRLPPPTPPPQKKKYIKTKQKTPTLGKLASNSETRIRISLFASVPCPKL